ncbi:MAG: hypothetical protein V7K92_17390 [Nostoc sp.]|uniref:hypothetical protein n=1 Tax=Nostoc sp. TaxID=1180 RepID=UPI002FF323AF
MVQSLVISHWSLVSQWLGWIPQFVPLQRSKLRVASPLLPKGGASAKEATGVVFLMSNW